MRFNYSYLRPLVLSAALLATGVARGAPDDDAQAAYDSGDYSTAYQIWSELAQQNDGRAQYALGVMHATGRGREKDPVKAFEWFSKASENGHVTAMYNLGIAYWTGQGTLEDRREATHWWRMAAERGDVVSQYNLGVAYYNGLGVERDFVEAARWIRNAAEQDYAPAGELLATLEEKLREASPAAETGDSRTATATSGSASTPAPDAEPAAAADNAATDAPAPTESEIVEADFTAGVIASDGAAVYAVNRNGTPVIEKLARDTPVKIIDSANGWTRIEGADGFKLWVFGSYVTGDDGNARISGKGVRARPLPSTGEQSPSPGKFNDNDRVVVLRTEGDWKYVQAPPHLHAWVKTNDVSVLDNPTRSWVDRWIQAGGSM